MKRPIGGRLTIGAADRVAWLVGRGQTWGYGDGQYVLASNPSGTRIVVYAQLAPGSLAALQTHEVATIEAALTTDEYHWVYCSGLLADPHGSREHPELGTRAILLCDGSLIRAGKQEFFRTQPREKVVQILRRTGPKSEETVQEYARQDVLWSLGTSALEEYAAAQPGFPIYTDATCPVCARNRRHSEEWKQLEKLTVEEFAAEARRRIREFTEESRRHAKDAGRYPQSPPRA